MTDITYEQVVYICDRKACKKCHPECMHTSNIDHAVNFKKVSDGKWMEKER